MKREHENKMRTPAENKAHEPGTLSMGQADFDALPQHEIDPKGQSVGYRFKRCTQDAHGPAWLVGVVTERGVVYDHIKVVS